MVIYFEIKV